MQHRPTAAALLLQHPGELHRTPQVTAPTAIGYTLYTIDTQAETDAHTHRQTDRDTQTHTHTHTQRQRDTQTHTHRHTHALIAVPIHLKRTTYVLLLLLEILLLTVTIKNSPSAGNPPLLLQVIYIFFTLCSY